VGCVCSFVSVVMSVSSPFCCVRVLAFHLGGGGALYFISVVFGGSVTGAQTCLVIVTSDGFGGLVASGIRVRGFKPGQSLWIFRASEKSFAFIPSEGK
jgi:hypothetical protein